MHPGYFLCNRNLPTTVTTRGLSRSRNSFNVREFTLEKSPKLVKVRQLIPFPSASKNLWSEP
ncbi:rCG21521 [Rattus norvegicus]|uniref:RCG21521 n=1 Tax=Rattus norvegicus TaxID=10116 RepID=A6J064_RAT|nr:rCG21521 [Rattus norvegicus]